jgi:cytochrome c oxidase subunit III
VSEDAALAAERAALRDPWRSLRRQREAANFGVWVFLSSELLFFGGIIMLYAAYRTLYPGGFAAAGRETSIWYGTANTAVLLTSSLSMAGAAESTRAGLRRMALWCLVVTIALGLAFLVIKGFEYAEDIEKHLIPGRAFALAKVPGASIFFAFYWVMTAIHAGHMGIGIGITSTLLTQAWRGSRSLASPAFEGAALYWHLVDVIWIFLYPLLYLLGRSG